jgi:hypothetical protein
MGFFEKPRARLPSKIAIPPVNHKTLKVARRFARQLLGRDRGFGANDWPGADTLDHRGLGASSHAAQNTGRGAGVAYERFEKLATNKMTTN